ncbi:DUF5686 family protein [Xylanibacter rodentium]
MKCRWFITFRILLGMFLFMPSFVLSEIKRDTLLMNRIFSYRNNFIESIPDTTDNIYLKYSFHTKRRNPTLFFVPSMYTIARGSRHNIGETYGKIKFKNINDYDIKRQVTTGSISSYRKTMPVMLDYIIPDLYNISLFNDHILSPFYSKNSKYYRYNISDTDGNNAIVSFKPRITNTQLVNGSAEVDRLTGRILRVTLKGNYDMIHFNVSADMGNDSYGNPLLPTLCQTEAGFRFLGNDIDAHFLLVLDNKTSLPDSTNTSDIKLMDSIRPIPLADNEKEAYRIYIEEKTPRDTLNSKSFRRKTKLRKIAWDIIGDHMLNSIKAENERVYIKFSPLVNPLYMSYSGSRGLSYKINMGARYNFSANSNITLSPHMGYNFKIKQWYFNIPMRYTYNKKHDAWTELTWKTGNRITNSSVLDILKNETRDTIDFSSLDLDYFDDHMLQLKSNISLFKHFNVSVGCVYHQRNAVNKKILELIGKPSVYKSFAPQVTLGFVPYKSGPIFTANYERSIPNVLGSDTKYEKWEFDLSFKKKLNLLSKYSFRVGGGFYTNKSTDYFVDFSNFRENYIPGGWDDDWSGNFQLLNSQWYNASKYYIRTNFSYESPLLLLTWMPVVGRYIETERIYVSVLQIEYTKPYFEIGYGFTTRYLSIGAFGSFLEGKPKEFGCKFTFELFRKW